MEYPKYNKSQDLRRTISDKEKSDILTDYNNLTIGELCLKYNRAYNVIRGICDRDYYNKRKEYSKRYMKINKIRYKEKQKIYLKKCIQRKRTIQKEYVVYRRNKSQLWQARTRLLKRLDISF